MACYQADHLDENQEVKLEFEDLALDHEIMYNTTSTTVQDVGQFKAQEITDFLAGLGIMQQTPKNETPNHDEL